MMPDIDPRLKPARRTLERDDGPEAADGSMPAWLMTASTRKRRRTIRRPAAEVAGRVSELT